MKKKKETIKTKKLNIHIKTIVKKFEEYVNILENLTKLFKPIILIKIKMLIIFKDVGRTFRNFYRN